MYDDHELLGDFIWFSRYHDKDFFNQQYDPSYLGKYWCQVINTTADPDQPLMRSNVFTLLAPENYTQPTCVNQSTTVLSVDNLTCADHSELQTTLPAPTTTLSLSRCRKISDSTTASEDAKTGSIAVFIDHQLLLLLQIAMTQN